MNAQQDDLVDRNEILPLLGTVKRSGEWLLAFCPCHQDGSKHGGKAGQSLGLSDTGVLRCFAGCEFKDVIAALRGPGYRQPTPIKQAVNEQLVKQYGYCDMDGTLIAEKARFEGDGHKSFKWRLPGAEKWDGLRGLTLSEIPLYGVERLKDLEAPVYFVEGEKACEACWDAGLLAVTHGGGASTKDFGTSLDCLKGRSVYLWPDNDGPGRAYMTLLQAKLAGIADIHLVTPPIALPEKADAFDYFAFGGSVEGLQNTTPFEPIVTILADDALRVVIPTMTGAVSFEFSELEKASRELNCALVVTCPGGEPYNERLNLESSTARNSLRVDLDKLYGKEFSWTSLLNKAIYRARESFLNQDRAVDVFDIPDPVGEPMLIAPLLVNGGPTIFFGDGSSMKSFIAFQIALCASHGVEFCGMRVPMMRVLVIDYEDSESNFRRRLARLATGLGGGVLPMGVFYWDARGIPLKDQWEAIRKSCDRNGIGWLIIDSAAPACGGPPEDAVAALAYFRTLKKIGLPSLTIAHISKAGEGNTQKPFGSVYWHNEARRTWFVKRIQEEDSDEIDVGLFNRKVNDGRKPLPIGLHVSFTEMEGPVRMRLQSVANVPELLSETPARNQVWETLEARALTVSEIASETGLATSTIDQALRRGPFVQAGHSADSKGRPANLWRRA